MNEDKIMELLKQSAEQVEIPAELEPEQIVQMLDKKKKTRHFRLADKRMAAAMVILFCGSILFAAAKLHPENGADTTAESNADNIAAETEQSTKYVVASLGDTYKLAENYGDVYDVLKDSNSIQNEMTEESLEDTDGATTDVVGNSMSNMNSYEESLQDKTDSSTSSESMKQEDYATTNLVTEGVDESDIAKTDGDYIYSIENNQVVITDVREKALKKVTSFTPQLESAADRIYEIYVDNDKLILIVQHQNTNLSSTEQQAKKGAVASVDILYLNTNITTAVLTYDISDRSTPVLLGELEQDGSYQTSRKIGDIVYLFTNEQMETPVEARSTAIKEDSLTGWIPLVAGKAVAADCIYLPEYGNNSMLMSSLDMNKPDKAIDSKLVVNDYAQIYVSNNAVYLYNTTYQTGVGTTGIAKFALDEAGKINAVNATCVAGEIRDTFAINEYNGYLRVLTTNWSTGEVSNGIYILDDGLALVGKIDGIADGEEIYSARFMGNTGYFVTYRNTDPLFTVDLSDVSNPVLVGELSVTGFSEYLHFWGEDKLLGIGYETDPDTGSTKGVKLSMFDITDPTNVTEVAKYVIENANYSEALYNYKAVLISQEKNLIGFTVESYENSTTTDYLAFSYDEQGFKNVMSEPVAYTGNESFRSMYVNQLLYLVTGEDIIAYDMSDGYTYLKNRE